MAIFRRGDDVGVEVSFLVIFGVSIIILSRCQNGYLNGVGGGVREFSEGGEDLVALIRVFAPLRGLRARLHHVLATVIIGVKFGVRSYDIRFKLY